MRVRQEFINPLFAALGWDVDNQKGYAEPYKDVVHEDSLRVGEAVKAPDYSFRIGGSRVFFVEAKSPSVSIKDEIDPAFQIRRYAWSANLRLSVLTNFKEFAVYDCRVKPDVKDKPAIARTLYFRYDELPQRWAEFSSIFGREAVLKGGFDRYSGSVKLKRGTAEVDEAFLDEIEGWRESLAKEIALRNPTLTRRALNSAVQRTIDRIIFLRICEDRGIEPYGQLREIASTKNIYEHLGNLFRKADDRYNSGLFHFKNEKGREEQVDSFTLGLTISDKPLKEILGHLYYPQSPYEFAVLPAHILGQVYEQFLGKVIRLTSGHRAVVEFKPEVMKAHGVYYTPAYIVDLIVEKTVSELLAGKTPKQASKIKIVDPACGSGSFLLIAYQQLLDWHLNWYVTDGTSKHKKQLYQAKNGDWQLTTGEKKRILLNNIFGVDVDADAVETTKLSLLLKVLEGESRETLDAQLKLFHERALPDLGANIQCGNSLLGPEIYSGKQISFMSDEERYTDNAFDWDAAFPDVFRAGGFDAVIGNPPYVYRNATKEYLKDYYKAQYESTQGNFDLYKFFIEKGLDLLRSGGKLGFIVSSSFLIPPTFSKLRDIIADNAIEMLIPLGPKVFKKATVDTAIMVATRTKPSKSQTIEIRAPQVPTDVAVAPRYRIRQFRFDRNPNHEFDVRLTDAGWAVVERLFKEFPDVESGFEFGVGINTGFIRDELVAETKVDDRYHRMIPGDGIARYGGVKPSGWIMYDAEYVQSRGVLGRSLPLQKFFDEPKILVVRTRNLSLERRIIATIDTSKGYNLNRLSNIIARPRSDLHGLLGILSSSLFQWLYFTRFYDYEIKPVYLRSSPLADTNDTALRDLVVEMLRLHGLVAKATTEHEKVVLERQISVCESQIDERVYRLYRITDKEHEAIDQNLAILSSTDGLRTPVETQEETVAVLAMEE